MVFAKSWSKLFGSKRAEANAASTLYATQIKNSPRTLNQVLLKHINRLSEYLVGDQLSTEPTSEGDLNSTLDDADLTLGDLDDFDKMPGLMAEPTNDTTCLPGSCAKKLFTFKDLSQVLKATEDFKFYLKLRAKDNRASASELDLIDTLSAYPVYREGSVSIPSFTEGIESLTKKIASTGVSSPMMDVYYSQLLHVFTQLRQDIK